MRRNWTPSIVPESNDQNVYLVLDDLGRLGRIWPEADAEATDLETVITDLLTGQYSSPVRVVAFNTAERWSEDVFGRCSSGNPSSMRSTDARASHLDL
jgi:hypothetical protein